TGQTLQSTYGAFEGEPEASFRDSSLPVPADVASTPHDVIAGEPISIEFTVTNTSMTRGGGLVVAMRVALETFADGTALLQTPKWELDTLGHLPIGTGSSHAFRARVLTTGKRPERPTLCGISAHASMKAGYWRPRLEQDAKTAVRVWSPFAAECL